MSYCTIHDGELMPCKTCAAIARRQQTVHVTPSASEADRILAEAQGLIPPSALEPNQPHPPLPEGMLDGPGAPSTAPDPYLCEGIVDRPKWAGTEVPRAEIPPMPIPQSPIEKAAAEHAAAKKDLAIQESNLARLRDEAKIVKEKITLAHNEVIRTRATLYSLLEEENGQS